MTLDLLTEDKVVVKTSTTDWSTAIHEAAQPLLNANVINEGYVDAMINSVNEFGPYIVIAPEIAIAHARPNGDVNEVGLSLLKLKEHVNFSEEGHYASLVFVLSAVDGQSHLTVLQDLASALGYKDTVQQLLATQDKAEILNLLKETDE